MADPAAGEGRRAALQHRKLALVPREEELGKPAQARLPAGGGQLLVAQRGEAEHLVDDRLVLVEERARVPPGRARSDPRLLQHDDAEPAVGELAGGRQAGDAGADDDGVGAHHSGRSLWR